MQPESLAEAKRLGTFIDASPTPFHACFQAALFLDQLGFEAIGEKQAWSLKPGKYYLVRGGSLVAWVIPEDARSTTGFRVVAAHTDSPNLRIKPQPDTGRAEIRQLGVEIYGGVLLNSWLDRDLGLAGRVWLRGEQKPKPKLFQIDKPILRVPQLAIHLNREIYQEGLRLNKQQHMAPMWGLQNGNTRNFKDYLAQELNVEADDILSWEAMCHDLTPSSIGGQAGEFLNAPRLDNLCSSFCALSGLQQRLSQIEAWKCIPVVCLFDHEEVGSQSRSGAGSTILKDVLERVSLSLGGSREDFMRAVSSSVCVSADMAHATHPNYPEKHEADHWVIMNQGPVIKINTNLRYASEGETEAVFQQCCERAEIPYQKFVNRTDLACGSTIGPITAANIGIRTVDVGNPQLAMHSAREICGSEDPAYMSRALVEFYE